MSTTVVEVVDVVDVVDVVNVVIVVEVVEAVVTARVLGGGSVVVLAGCVAGAPVAGALVTANAVGVVDESPAAVGAAVLSSSLHDGAESVSAAATKTTVRRATARPYRRRMEFPRDARLTSHVPASRAVAITGMAPAGAVPSTHCRPTRRSARIVNEPGDTGHYDTTPKNAP